MFLAILFMSFKVEELYEFPVATILNLLKEWSQLHFMKVVGVLACTMLLVPAADAVDALKTCTCLLKECRYSLYLGSNVFPNTLCLSRKMIASAPLLAHVIKNFLFLLLCKILLEQNFTILTSLV